MGKGFDDLKREVIDPGLCTRCGGCAASCPVQVLEFGREGISLSGKCIECGACVGICPGKGVDMSRHETRLLSRSRKRHLVSRLGIYLSREQLTSSRKEMVRIGYYGGRITTILTAALEAGLIDAALVTLWPDDGSLSTGRGIIARNREEIIEAASSKYAFSSVLTLLPEVRKDNSIERAALVCLPCQAQAFRNMETDPSTKHLTMKVGYVICHQCGAPNMSEENWRKAASELMEQPPDQISAFTYSKISSTIIRLEVTAPDGETEVRDLNIAKFLHRVNKGPRWYRCNLCPDYSGELSDLSFGAPVIRTEKGKELIDNAKGKGLLKRSSFKKSNSQNLMDLIVSLRKIGRARRNIHKRRKRGLPFPVYR
ncbi:MAG: Coenzyme F420 hydrogenase/dehydrogenase, beta subunit C-terminal domain [Thermoplasmatota archaeon]